MRSFWCPICNTPCPTLRDLLVCHPRELRKLTSRLGRTGPLVNLGLRAIVGQPLSEATRRAAWLVLNPEQPQPATGAAGGEAVGS